MALEIRIVPALTDNYVYLLRDTATGTVGVVDPSTPEEVIAEVEKSGWEKPKFIFNTHHHWDHVGGNEKLQSKYGAELLCSVVDEKRVPGKVRQTLAEGARFALGESQMQVMEIPGHTLGHIALYFPEAKAVFVGDTLFGMGCGRLFEGTIQQMWNSLSRLKALPEDTNVYCGHEYTMNNGRFAMKVDPSNQDVVQRTKWAAEIRKKNGFTIPFSIGEENKTNPFLRADTAATFGSLRKRKDDF